MSGTRVRREVRVVVVGNSLATPLLRSLGDARIAQLPAQIASRLITRGALRAWLSLPRRGRSRICGKFYLSLLRGSPPRDHDLVLWYARVWHADLILSFDIWNEPPPLADLRRLGIRCIVVQLGVLLPRNLSRLTTRSTSFDVLALWGSRHESQLTDAGVCASKIVHVGSLNEAAARRTIGPTLERPIVAVVLFKASNSGSNYRSSYRREQFSSRLWLLTQLRRIRAELDLDLRIIIQPGASRDLEWQQRAARVCSGADLPVSLGVDPYASYRAVMSAALVIGDQSSLLAEALSRGIKTLSVSYSDDPSMRLPFSGPWEMINPSYQMLRDQIRGLLAMSRADWWTRIEPAATGICHDAEGSDAIDHLDQLVYELLD